MQLIPINNIQIGERIREPLAANIATLAGDIVDKGLLQPIVITSLEDPWLVCGEHRIRAIAHIEDLMIQGGNDPIYTYNEVSLPADVVPYVTVGQLSPTQMIEYEVAENVIRVDVPWQARAKAMARLQELSGTAKTATAKILLDAGDKRQPEAIRNEIDKAVIVSASMDNPKVAAAKSLTEAFRIVSKDATLISQRAILANTPQSLISPHHFYPMSMQDGFAQMHSEWSDRIGFVDTIVSDPPYGIDADTWTTKFRNNPHEYRDNLSKALADASFIFSEGLRITRERANLFMFCAPQYWHHLFALAEEFGWAPWPRPVIWKKSNEGIRPQGSQGFCYTYETILYATKGGKGLLRSINDVIEVYKVDRNVRIHGAQKPVEIIQLLIEISSMPGDIILDPTCGSGTIFPACNLTKTIGIGIEQDPQFWPFCQERQFEGLAPTTDDASTLEDL